MSRFRGMSGCLRQAVVDADLEKKIRIKDTNVYNDKFGENSRRFNWDCCIIKKLTKPELKKFEDAVTPLLAEHDLTVTQVSKFDSASFSSGDIYVYADIGSNSKVDELRKKAKKLGYKLVKI